MGLSNLFLPSITCPRCQGAKQVVVLSLTGGKHLASRKCPDCKGRGTLPRH